MRLKMFVRVVEFSIFLAFQVFVEVLKRTDLKLVKVALLDLLALGSNSPCD